MVRLLLPTRATEQQQRQLGTWCPVRGCAKSFTRPARIPNCRNLWVNCVSAEYFAVDSTSCTWAVARPCVAMRPSIPKQRPKKSVTETCLDLQKGIVGKSKGIRSEVVMRRREVVHCCRIAKRPFRLWPCTFWRNRPTLKKPRRSGSDSHAVRTTPVAKPWRRPKWSCCRTVCCCRNKRGPPLDCLCNRIVVIVDESPQSSRKHCGVCIRVDCRCRSFKPHWNNSKPT